MIILPGNKWSSTAFFLMCLSLTFVFWYVWSTWSKAAEIIAGANAVKDLLKKGMNSLIDGFQGLFGSKKKK